MPRRTKSLPKYRRHKASGQALVTLNGRDIYLGTYDSPESHEEYRRIIAEWATNHYQLPAIGNGARGEDAGTRATSSELTLNEIFLSYWDFVEQYYRKNGQPTWEVSNIKQALRPFLELYGRERASGIGPLNLKTYRQALIDRGLCRKVINKHVARVKGFFRWATENELVPVTVYHALKSVAGLRKGRSEARETEPVTPVPDDMIEAVLPHVSPQVRAMIELQRVTGMRPGEVVLMRGCDVNTSSTPWTYTPESHKTEHYNKRRVIYLGPRAQQVLEPWLKPDLQAYLFSPAEAMEAQREQRNEKRRTPTSCGNNRGSNRTKRPRKSPGDRYTTDSYGQAITEACKKAYPPPERLQRRQVPGKREGKLRWETNQQWRDRLGEDGWAELQRWRRDHQWSPNQLRHNAATYLRKQYGIEAARVILGHSSPAVTEVYAELDHAKAAQIMGEVG